MAPLFNPFEKVRGHKSSQVAELDPSDIDLFNLGHYSHVQDATTAGFICQNEES